MDHDFAIRFFGALFAIMNPFANLPIFLSVTEGQDRAEQRRTALQVVAYSAIMGAAIALAGDAVLTLFGITVNDFRVAGGLVLLLLALSMVQGRDSPAHGGTPAENAARPDDAPVAFYPMTFPIIVGPGTVTALIVFAQQASGPAGWAVYAGVFAAVLALLGAVLFFAADIAGHLSRTTRAILTRLMGMILAAIAVEMIATGLKALLPGLG